MEKSSQAQEAFPEKQSLLDLVHPSLRLKVKKDLSFKNEMEISLLTSNDQYLNYRVYPYLENEHQIHLFLFQLPTPLSEIKSILDNVESKFTYFQKEIKDRKQYIDQAVMEIQEASVESYHYQNVEKLAAGIAHEIRNPLTTVRGFIQLLKPYLTEIGKEQYAEIALDELNRANEIIYEFLNASKPPEKMMKSISLNRLVKDTTLLYESEAILKDIMIMNHFASRDVEIIANQKQIKQVLINMLKNAMEAIEENRKPDCIGEINFYTVCEGHQVSIVIQDNGPGMSEMTLNKLFLPFHTTKENGTGVGLSVCKKIIDDHNGMIKVESALGNGTTFRIQFPIENEKS